MSVITFWNNKNEETGKTMSLVAIATYMAINYNNKIFNRELERAKISLEAAKKADSNKSIIFVTHYPPSENIINLVKMYNVKYWIYGHIHSNYEESLVNIEGIETYLTSGDYLEFKPLKICE